MAGIESLEVFSENQIVIRAVERELEIIGEAAVKLRKLGVSLEQSDSLINRRNTIIHQYGVVQPKTLWYFVNQQLPELQEEVASLLLEMDE